LIKSADHEYVTRLRRGEVDAFDALYLKYHRQVYANIFKLVKETEASEDILQEVFIALWENRLAIDAGQPVAGWLFVVSYHKSIAYLKKALKRSLLQTAPIAEIYHDEQDLSLKDRQLLLLEEAVQQLSPQKRKVFELCKLQGKTYEEAANELNISKHTVKEYLSLAIAGIKDYIRNNPEYIMLLVSTFLRPPY
jgi:RNA polymerase sigma-70 factor (ECF subfamily)